jgi:ATP synthase protein I
MDKDREEFTKKVGSKEERKIKARRDKAKGMWFGLGMMGVIGWSVAIPTFIGVLLGVWMDTRYPGHISWTLTFMFGGLTIGCVNAWYWVKREQEKIEGSQDDQ